MSFEAASITGTIGLDESPTIRAFKKVEKGAGDMKKEVEEALGDAGKNGAKAFLQGVNGEFGKKSMLGQVMKLAMGGGAIAGVSMAAKELESITKKFADLTDAWRKGETTFAEMGGEMIRETPIFGSMVRCVDNLKEAFTGEEVAAVKAERAMKNHVDQMRALDKQAKEFKGLASGSEKSLEDMRLGSLRESTLARAPESFRPILETGYSLQDQLAKIQEQTTKAEAAVESLRGNKNALEKVGGSSADIAEQTRKLEADRASLIQAQQNASGEYGGAGAMLYGVPDNVADSLLQMNQQLDVLKQKQEIIDATNTLLGVEERKLDQIKKDAQAAADAAKDLAGIKTRAALENMAGKVWDSVKDALKRASEFLGHHTPGDRASGMDESLRFIQQPNPGVRAQEVFGTRFVTPVDLPQPWVKITDLNAQQLAVQQQISQKISRMGGDDHITMVSMP
jgi:hypothetical protein